LRTRRRISPATTASAILGAAVALLVGGWLGPLLGVLVALAVHRWTSGLETRAARARRARLSADVPAAADLLAACLVAGSGLETAAGAVADAVGGPLGDRLWATVSTLRLGGDPVACWRALEDDAPLAPLARALARAAASGAPVADVVSRLAEEQRRDRRWAAEAAARRVGVQSVAPLGVCFLPAFVLLGIVPVVAGIAQLVLPSLQ
jgi:pilus assembly protein TadC